MAWLVAAPVTVALVAAGVLAYRAITDRPDVTVPSVVGRDIFQATAILTEAGFDVEPLVAQSPQPGGTILEQRPRDGQRISEGDTVRITVSDIKAEMPDVIGLDETSAGDALRDVGLVIFTFVDDFRDDVEPGTITASDPLAHQYALKDGTVTLSVARDPSVEIPDVRNLDEATARAELEGRGSAGRHAVDRPPQRARRRGDQREPECRARRPRAATPSPSPSRRDPDR